MNAFTTSVALWLADFLLLSTALLLLAVTILAVLRQPAQRLAVTRSTLIALFLLATLCAAPGWSLVHLFSHYSSQQPRANDSPALTNQLASPIESPATTPPTHKLTEINVTSPNESIDRAPPVIGPIRKRIPWPDLCVSLFSLGSLAVAAWLCLGSIAAHRLVQSATPAPAQLINIIGELACSQHHRVRLLLTTKIDVAVAVGIRRPAILLPQSLADSQSAIRNPQSEISSVLAHELAHIANHDLHWLAASRALLILLWTQPLYWLLRRRMRLDQEALADAAAAELTTRQTYAEQLVAWARQLTTRPAPRLSAAVGLWEGPSQLRQRIALLVDEHFTVLRNCSRRLRLSALTLAIASSLALSSVTVQPPNRADAQDAATTRAPVLEHVPNTVFGRAEDEHGRPLAGVEALLFRINRNDATRKLVAQKTTDAHGVYRFDNVIDIDKEFPGGKFPSPGTANGDFLELVLRAPGRVTDTRLMIRPDLARRGELALVKMPPAATLRGRITGPDGKPVAAALVSVGMTSFEPIEGVKSARTDADGNYTIADVAPFDVTNYRKQQEQQQSQLEQQRRSGATATYAYFHAPPMLAVEHPRFAVKKTDHDNIPGTKDIQLDPPAAIEGRVIYADSRQPAANAIVKVATPRPKTRQLPTMNFYNFHTATVRADANGRYRFTTLPAGNYDLWAEADGWMNIGIPNLTAPANQTTVATELVLTPGGLVHVRLVDNETREPVSVPSDSQASISASPQVPIGLRTMFFESIDPQPDGTFELRVLPGDNFIYIAGVNVNNEPKWVGTTMIGLQPTKATVADGQTVTVDVPVVDSKEVKAQSVTVSSPPNSVTVVQAKPKTDDITGQVLNPDGAPAAGVRVIAFSMRDPDNISKGYGYQRTETDADGRFKLSIYSGGKEVFWILPREFAQQTHVINDRRGDLGVFKLENGLHVHGRVLDREGKPIPDIWVNAELKGGPAFRQIEMPVADNIERASLTDADGRFDLGPLPPGSYEVVPDEKPEDDFENVQPRKPLPAAFLPQQIELSAASELDEIEIRPVESITLQVRFLDSKGNPTRGNGFFLIGTTPDGKRLGLRRDQTGQEAVTFVVPKGLEKTVLDFPLSSMRYRCAPGEPWTNGTSIDLGTLDRDWREIEVVRYREPTLVVAAADAAGNPVPGFKPAIFYHFRDKEEDRKNRWIDDVRGDVDFEPTADGRWQSEYLLPDEEFTLTISAEGYKPFEQGTSMSEGKLSEVNVALLKSGDATNLRQPATGTDIDRLPHPALVADLIIVDIGNSKLGVPLAEAIEALNRQLKQRPDNVDNLLSRSVAYQRLGNLKDAIADLEHVIRLNPDGPIRFITHNNLAYLLSAATDDSLRDGERAVELARRAIEIAETSAPQALPELFDTLAAAYAETGDYDQAINAEQKAIELAPQDEDYRQHLELYREKKPLRAPPRPAPTGNAATPTTDDLAVTNLHGCVAIGDRFLLCPVTTDGQRRLLGYVAEPEDDASLCVLVNYSAFKDEKLDPHSPTFTALSDQLSKLARNDSRYAKFRVVVGSYQGVPFEETRDQAEALAKQCEALGRAAGFKRTRSTTAFGGYHWKSFVANANAAASRAKSDVEDVIGDDRVKVLPVRTFLARLETDADCVVDIIPKLRATEDSRFPDAFVPAMTEFIPKLQYERKLKLLIRVRHTDAGQKAVKDWTGNQQMRLALARQFGFVDCAVEQSMTDDFDAPKTDDITGQVLKPDGTPAAGVAVYAHSMTNPKRFTSDTDPEPSGFHRGQTDADGRFRLSLYPAPNAILWILPQQYSQQTHVLNERRGDLGPFQLVEGIRLHGRVLNDDGSPLAGVWVNAQLEDGPAQKELPVSVTDQIQRSALTDDQGRFEMRPLPASTYDIEPARQAEEYGQRTVPPKTLPAAFLPERIAISAASELEEIELRALPAVVVTAQFVDSRGNPTAGYSNFFFTGQIPGQRYHTTKIHFDDRGKATIHAPRGLDNTRIDIPYGSLAIRHRATPGGPLRKNLEVILGTLDGDRQVEFIRYQPPELIVDAKDADGKVPPGLKVSAAYTSVEPAEEHRDHRVTRDVRMESKPDGRSHSYHLLPDEEFTLTVSADGYKPVEQKLSIPEGERFFVNVGLAKVDDADASRISPASDTPDDQGSNLLRNIRLAAEPILAKMAADHGYGLPPGKNLRRVPPPFPPIRMEYYRTGHPTQAEAIRRGPTAMTFRWENDRLTNWGLTFGDSADPGYSLSGVLDALLEIKSQQIDGPANVLNTRIPGDWVVRPGISDSTIVAELQAMLQTELALPIKLEFREVKRPIYVARGDYELTPLPGHTGRDETHYENKTVVSDEIEIFGKQLVPNSGSGGGTGDFNEFLNWLGRWIGAPIVSEVTTGPSRQLTWNLHGQSPSTEQMRAEDRDAALVLANITAQTGLTFAKEERPVRILFVEPTE